MSYETMRRSTRIPKELAILLTGSDMDGKGFSEMTRTVLLSRHGAGIISTYKLSAEQEVILRYLDTNKEALVRVVGRIGSEGEVYTYGVAFADPSNIDFWGIDFAPMAAQQVLLECGSCKRTETVEHSEVESDVFIINEGIVRFCKQCGDSTLWKRASEAAAPEEQPAPVATKREAKSTSFAGATSAAPVQTTTIAELVTSAPPVQTATISERAMSAAPVQTATIVQEPPELVPEATPAPAPPPEKKPVIPPENRRKHSRMKVSYKASIRRSGFPDDIVTCEDMSKGGICFKSRKQYFARTAIEVAVPYSPGSNAIFVPAEIVWVQELPNEKSFRCGLAYAKTLRAT